MEQGLHPILKHVPVIGNDRGPQIGVYARAVLQGGIVKFMYMNMDDVNKAKEASRAKNSPAWKNWPEEMARKTVVKRFCKLLPQADTLHEAVAIINEHEGIDIERDKQASAKELDARFAEPAPETGEVTGAEIVGHPEDPCVDRDTEPVSKEELTDMFKGVDKQKDKV
jgi:recombinational DNA repair protein RecT